MNKSAGSLIVTLQPKNLTRIERDFHNFRLPVSVSLVMRQAFVLQLGSETEAARLIFVGCIEEIDTGRELRFKSTDELARIPG